MHFCIGNAKLLGSYKYVFFSSEEDQTNFVTQAPEETGQL